MLRRLFAPLFLVWLVAFCSFPSRVLAQRWKLEVRLGGTARATYSAAQPPPIVKHSWFIQGGDFDVDHEVALSTINPTITDRAGNAISNGAPGSDFAVSIGVRQELQATNGDHFARFSSEGAKFVITLTWDDEGTYQLPPLLSTSPIVGNSYGHYFASAKMSNQTQVAPRLSHSKMKAQVEEGFTQQVTAQLPGTSEPLPFFSGFPKLRNATITGNGTITAKMKVEIPFSFCSDIELNPAMDGTSNIRGDNSATIGVMFSLAGNIPARFSLPAVTGSNKPQSDDPTYTRWLPLSFSPQIDSQPFAEESGFLAPPWGNIHCNYSIAFKQIRTADSNPLNFDLNSGSLLYAFSFVPNGQGNVAWGPRSVFAHGESFETYFVITDATGERLNFGSGLNPYGDVHADLSQQTDAMTGQNVFVLENAGPPGAMKAGGEYRYVFEIVSYNPLRTRLKSLADNKGNQQILNWGQGGILTVADVTSGRSLIFEGTPGGYVTGVVAPNGSRTALTFDGTNHLKQLDVKTLGGTLLTREQFDYDTLFPHSVASHTVNGISTAYTYAADPYSAPSVIPRLQSVKVGGQTVATYQYGYDWVNSQYGSPNLGSPPLFMSKASRTTTITDAENNSTQIEYLLRDGSSGSIKSLNVTAPAYFGASAGSNRASVDFLPDMVNPNRIEMRTPYEIDNGLPWTTLLNPQGSVTNFTDPMAHTWQFEYDASGRHLTKITDPTGIWARAEYDTLFQLRRVYDKEGSLRTKYEYDKGQLISATTPTDASASHQDETFLFNYHATTGDLLQITDPLGDKAQFTEYDAFGDPVQFSVYPDSSNPAQSRAITSRIEWDAAQRVKTITQPNGLKATPIYDTSSSIVREVRLETPPYGTAPPATVNKVFLNYDAKGRANSSSDQLGALGSRDWDARGNIKWVKDALGNATTFVYGANNELKSVQTPIASVDFTYEAGGRLKTVRDERQTTTTFIYDAAGRLTRSERPGDIRTYAYDDAGRLTLATDAAGSRHYVYEPVRKRLDKVITTVTKAGSPSVVYETRYVYYPDGSVSTQTLFANNRTFPTTYEYDAAGQLWQMTDPANNVTQWTYDHAGRLTRQKTTTRNNATVQHDITWGVSGISGDPVTAPIYPSMQTISVNGSVFREYSSKYSALGLLSSRTWTQAPVNQISKNGQSTFQYDQRGRLTSSSELFFTTYPTLSFGGEDDDPGVYTVKVQKSGVYGYDAANHRQAVPPTGQPAWTYDAAGRLLSAPPSGGLTGASNLAYDAAGNLTHINNLTLEYDTANRLTKILGAAGGTIEYGYDGENRRIWRSQNGAVQYFLYAGDSADLLGLADGSGLLNQLVVSGAWGLIAEQPVTPSGGFGSGSFLGYDPDGDTVVTWSESGVITGSADWTASGETAIAPTGSVQTTRFGVGGQGGGWTDSGLVFDSPADSRAYVPWVRRRTQSWDWSGWGYQPESGDPDDFYDGSSMGLYGPTLRQFGAGMNFALTFAADMNPVEQLRQIAQGTGVWGKHLSPGERAKMLTLMCSGQLTHGAVHAVGALGKLKAAAGAGKFAGVVGATAGSSKFTSSGMSRVQSVLDVSRNTVNGRTVYQMKIDPGVPANVNRNRVAQEILDRLDKGATNLDLMKTGNAPIGSDGLPINLHHVIGQEPGPMLEILQSKHSRFTKALHRIIIRGRSFRRNPALAQSYEKYRGEYWKTRAQDF